MTTKIELTVEATGGRLDKYIADHTDLSRAHIQKLIREGKILIGGRTARPKRNITVNERITIEIPAPEMIDVQPENIPLQIVYEDNDVLVVDKPAGLTVHPAAGNWTGTLVNAVLAHCPDLMGIKGTQRPGIVHRLDKDTSGLIVIAKNDTAQLSLSQQIKDRKIIKKYVTLVHGILTPEEGAIEGPIGRHPRDRKKMAIVSNGKDARTVYSVREYIDDYTLIDISTETGRTHQIRVHLSSIGHPVVGDSTYGGKSMFIKRQFLHASKLGFKLPSNDNFKELESPLPFDLEKTLENVRS